MGNKEPKYHPPIHKFPIYGLIVCSLISITVGIYLHVHKIEIYSNDGENEFGLNGIGTIILGLMLAIFPINTIIKQGKEKKQFENNIFNTKSKKCQNKYSSI